MMGRRWFRAALASAALLAAAHGAAPAAAQGSSTVFDLGDRLGKSVPAVTLTESNGDPLALDGLRDRPTYLFLFASWCGPCRMAVPFIKAAYAKYGDRVRFVGVDVLEDAAAAKAAVSAEAFPFPVAIFPIEALDAAVQPDAQLRAGMKYRIPADYLIDANGVVRYAWHGLQVDGAGAPVDVLPSYFAKLGLQ